MKYAVDVTIEIELEGDEEEAFKAVDVLLQRAWDTDRGRHHVNRNWHFSILEGSVTDITDDETTPVDEAVAEDQRLLRKFNDDATTD